MTTLKTQSPMASATPASPAVTTRKPGWRWAAYIIVGLVMGFPIGSLIATIGATVSKRNRSIWLRTLATSALGLVMLVVLLLGLGLTTHHDNGLGNLPSASAPVQGSTPVGGANPTHPIPVAAPASTAGLQLPAESSTDKGYAVANEMMVILNKAYATGNVAYLDHYYASHSVQGYSTSATQVAKGSSRLRFYMATGPNYLANFQSNSDGSITATYYQGTKNPSSTPTITMLTFSWHTDVQEWRYDSSPFAAG